MALTWPLVQEPQTGEDVRTVQYLVTAHGHATAVDGIFGPLTKAAVEAFQASSGLAVDGIVGPQTWPQLIIQVQQGSAGDAVRAVQSQIHSRNFATASIAVDGIFGPATDFAVRAFQTWLGLAVDGIVGPQTWIRLVNGYLAEPSGGDAAKAVFAAWQAGNRDEAAKNATPQAVSQIFSAADSWIFQGEEDIQTEAILTWKRSNCQLVITGATPSYPNAVYCVVIGAVFS